MLTLDNRIPSKFINPIQNALLALSSDCLFVYVSGSFIEGFANETSDIDLFAIHEKEAPIRNALFTNSTGAQAEVECEGDAIVDTEHLTQRRLKEIVDKLRLLDIANDDGAFRNLTNGELQFLHRLVIGVPLAGEEVFNLYRLQIDVRRISCVIASRALLNWHEDYNDALGAIESRQSGTAMLQSRAALADAVDAYLACKGSTNNKPKWRYEKVAAYSPELSISILEKDIDCSIETSEILAKAAERMSFSQHLSQLAYDMLEDLKEQLADA
ncbi:nucleotidyltransferase domain-containing protein [Bombiscardovia coagulans]|uniref:Polymerase nucleotidyl transferase domain-containing protein n=1 Tax=Bombiscardovia coagulans TaxID=686666 RepID=A0A261EVG9_9BIFI|nr:nucleotidyltransferase domain-containing protein [Bombiscardovia coagulans]OZG50859.1 hypothetical protein BOCO_0045 [Bombiscardovia coagulans]